MLPSKQNIFDTTSQAKHEAMAKRTKQIARKPRRLSIRRVAKFIRAQAPESKAYILKK